MMVRSQIPINHFELSKTETLILCIFSGIIGTVGFFSNLLISVTVLRSRWRRELGTSTMLLLNLSIINLLFSAVFQPVHIWFLSTDTPFHVVADIRIGIGYGLRMATICSCTMIAFDRFMYMCFPLRYFTWITEKRVKFAIACAWILPGLFVLILFKTGVPLYHFSSFNLAIVLILYIRIYLTGRKQRRQIVAQYPHVEMTGGRLSKIRGNITIAVVLGVSIVSWLPILVASIASEKTSRVLPWMILLPSLTTCIEPCIYYRRIVTFRSALNSLLGLSRTRGVISPVAEQRRRLHENDGHVFYVAGCSRINLPPKFIEN